MTLISAYFILCYDFLDSSNYNTVSAPFLARLLIDIYGENYSGDETVKKLCLKALAGLGQRLSSKLLL